MKKEKDTQIEAEKKQRRLFKKKRGGIVLTENEVRQIKEGRKRLKKEMKKKKVYTRKEFELTCSSLGLYFDQNRGLGLFLWLFHGRALKALLGALAALMTVLFILSLISQMDGRFTINLNDEMYGAGFTLSEDKAFTHPTSQLFSVPVEGATNISISMLPEDLHEYEGNHSSQDYFAYSFFVRSESEKEDSTLSYTYEVAINSEGLNLGDAIWVMLFEDGKMTFHARAGEDGNLEAIPALSDNSRGYRKAPLMDQAARPDEQYQVIKQDGSDTFYRVMPIPFESDTIITSGKQEGVKPYEVHKYTVVVWLEGDDPDCTDELIGGHLGVEMNFRLLGGTAGADDSNLSFWDSIWKSLDFWED